VPVVLRQERTHLRIGEHVLAIAGQAPVVVVVTAIGGVGRKEMDTSHLLGVDAKGGTDDHLSCFR
jgi:hypothetical protein